MPSQPRLNRPLRTILIALAAMTTIAVGCQQPQPVANKTTPKSSTADGASGVGVAPDDSSPLQPLPPVSPQIEAFRQSLLQADEVAWRRLDISYLQMKAALSQLAVNELEYQSFVDQLNSSDPDTRANGMSGVAASRSPAALDHLSRALKAERDVFNRTIAVWCIRTFETDPRTPRILTDYLTSCGDLDLGRCLADNGAMVDFRSPFPLAGWEALKGLVVLRGKADMLHGDGWRGFVTRINKTIDPMPLTAVNMDRLRGEPRGGGDARQRELMEEWINEMNE